MILSMLLNKKKLIFVSPHSKIIGESYVLPKLVQHNLKTKDNLFYLFNSCGEWDNLEHLEKYIIKNKFRFIVNLAPNIEKLNPWLNYRIWLFFASISILFGLTYSLHFEKKIKSNKKIVVARMATSITSLVNLFKPLHTKLIASMAGVPKINLFRKIIWPLIYLNYKEIVTPSKLMIPYLQKITKNYDSNKYHFIENPVIDRFNLKLFHKNIHLRKLKIYNSQYQWRILFVGRLTRQKGLDLLIKSLVGIKSNYILDIIVDG